MTAGLAVLVAGAGSIGRRHVANLAALGVERLAVCDPDEERRAAPGVESFVALEAALERFAPDAVFVCTPPALHVEHARAAVAAGSDVFVEKPLAASLDGVCELEREAAAAGAVVQVGYNLHFDAPLLRVRELVDAGVIGTVRYARIEFGQYLPDWRPWQDYRASYTARRALGGGIVLDASHELAYALWLLGDPVDVRCLAGRVSELEVDVEDCATILLRFASGAHGDVHVDFVQRAPTRTCTLAGDRGTIACDLDARTVSVFRAATDEWQRDVLAGTGDDAYVEEVRHFLDCCATRLEPRVGLDLGRRTLAVALRALADAGVQ
jgi:predicted dehydrogenase